MQQLQLHLWWQGGQEEQVLHLGCFVSRWQTSNEADMRMAASLLHRKPCAQAAEGCLCPWHLERTPQALKDRDISPPAAAPRTAPWLQAEVMGKGAALFMNINAAKGLHEVMKTNLGPKGTIKMLVDGAGGEQVRNRA